MLVEEKRKTECEIYEKLNYKNITPIFFEELISTNQKAKELAVSGENNKLIIAYNQTGGRGRMGRNFFSSKGNGIYCSLLLRPELSIDRVVLLTAAAAVAVCETIELFSKKSAEIKWVNDIFVEGKKVCGILCESALNTNGNVEYIVLGIGVNIFKPENGFPKEIEKIAGAVFDKKNPKIKNAFIAEMINRFMNYYYNLNDCEFIKKYRERSFLTGKSITYICNGKKTNATVLDIDDKCRLKVKNTDEKIDFLSYGEVTLGSEKNIL